MYAASLSPRDSSISLRMASSSRPSCSTSSSVRWVYSLTSEIAMVAPYRRWSDCKRGGWLRSDVERALADSGGDTGLDLLVRLVELLAVAQVAHRSGDQRQRAGV